MLFMYPAVFRKTAKQKYEGYFPDLSCCTFSGDTLEEALQNAYDAENDWLRSELEEASPEFPTISETGDIRLEKNETVRNISVNIRLFEGWDE